MFGYGLDAQQSSLGISLRWP